MLNGIGGLCNVRNIFLYMLLNTLGFEVHFLSATMMQPNCHIILLVCINNNKYIVDVGNGFPYLKAMNLYDDKIYSHPYLKYKIVNEGNDHFSMQHKENIWRASYHFDLKLMPSSSFDAMLDKQYSDIGWGPFLTGIRVNNWTKDSGILIRDKLCLKIKSGVARERCAVRNFDDFKNLMDKYFWQDGCMETIDMKNAWRVLE